MKNDLTTGTRQDNISCPINTILFCTSDVPIRDAMLFQLHSLRDMKADVIIGKDAIHDQNITTMFECPWLPTISYVQMEDSSGFRYPLAPVGR
jgi:hypothetical protein